MAAKLLIVGGGKLGSALVAGLLSAGWAEPGELALAEVVPERRDELARTFPGVTVVGAAAPDTVDPEGGALLAVKPDVAEAVCRTLGAVGITRVLSVVVGLPSTRLEACLPDGSSVVRAMPNTPALIGAAMSAISGGSHATSADLAWAESILSAVGVVLRLPERYLDAVAAVSGSGPAYLFLVAEAMIEAGVLSGLPREVSRELVVQTMLGSSRLLAESGDEPETLRAAVTSPGGTTAAGLRALEARAVRSAFLEAVASAAERSRQLGR